MRLVVLAAAFLGTLALAGSVAAAERVASFPAYGFDSVAGVKPMGGEVAYGYRLASGAWWIGTSERRVVVLPRPGAAQVASVQLAASPQRFDGRAASTPSGGCGSPTRCSRTGCPARSHRASRLSSTTARRCRTAASAAYREQLATRTLLRVAGLDGRARTIAEVSPWSLEAAGFGGSTLAWAAERCGVIGICPAWLPREGHARAA